MEVRDGKDLLDDGVNALQMQEIISGTEDGLGVIEQILHLILAKLWLGVIGFLDGAITTASFRVLGEHICTEVCHVAFLCLASRCA